MSLSSTLTAPVTNFKLNNTSPHMFSEYWWYLIFIQHFKAIHNKNDDYKALFTPGIKMCLRSLVHNAKCRSKHSIKGFELVTFDHFQRYLKTHSVGIAFVVWLNVFKQQQKAYLVPTEHVSILGRVLRKSTKTMHSNFAMLCQNTRIMTSHFYQLYPFNSFCLVSCSLISCVMASFIQFYLCATV